MFEVELAEFARQVGASPTKQIVLVLDRAGWHTSVKLRVPDYVHRLFLPPYSPELQPAEHLWPLTNACLIYRHFAAIEELDEVQFAHCDALQQQPERIRSATLFHWWPSASPNAKDPGEGSIRLQNLLAHAPFPVVRTLTSCNERLQLIAVHFRTTSVGYVT